MAYRYLVSGVRCLVSRPPYPVARIPYSLFLCTVLLLTGCGLFAPEIQPLVLGAAPWQSGEQAVYRITDIDGNYAGTATYTLAQGGELWTFIREITAQGTTEFLTVEMGSTDYRPVQSLLIRTSAEGQQRATSTYTRGQVDIELESERSVVTFERQSIPTDVRDQRTLLTLVRALPLEGRYATRVNSYYPIRGQMERVTITIAGEEEVSVPLGRYETWRVVLANRRHETEAWFGKDAPYPLVKYVDGETGGTFELSEFAPTGE